MGVEKAMVLATVFPAIVYLIMAIVVHPVMAVIRSIFTQLWRDESAGSTFCRLLQYSYCK